MSMFYEQRQTPSPSPSSQCSSDMSINPPPSDIIASNASQQMDCNSDGEENINASNTIDCNDDVIGSNPYGTLSLQTALEAVTSSQLIPSCSQNVLVPLQPSLQPSKPTESSITNVDDVVFVASSGDEDRCSSIMNTNNINQNNKANENISANKRVRGCPDATDMASLGIINDSPKSLSNNLPSKVRQIATSKKRSSQPKTKRPDHQQPSSLQHQQQKLDKNQENSASVAGKSYKPPQICINLNQNGEMPSTLNIESLSMSFLIALFDDHTSPVGDYTIKLSGPRIARIHAESSSAYRSIIHILQDTNIQYNSYQMREERSLKVVIRGIHSSTNTSNIKSALQSMGYTVKSVFNPIFQRSHGTGTFRPNLFYVELAQTGSDHTSNNSIFKIRKLCHFIVSVEWPQRNKFNLPQCHRCQRHNHTAKYCHHVPRCVKCGNDHATAACTKPANTPAKCANCGQPHTANYKGCSIRIKLLESKMPKIINTKQGIANKSSNTKINNNQNSKCTLNKNKNKDKSLTTTSLKPTPNPNTNQNKDGESNKKLRLKSKNSNSTISTNQQKIADAIPSTSAQAAAQLANTKFHSSKLANRLKIKTSRPNHQPSTKILNQQQNASTSDSDSDSDLFL